MTSTPETLAPSTRLANRPVAELDLDRYAGIWHEIARLPSFFQRHCVDSVTAIYTRRPDGTLEVRNMCRTAEGALTEHLGIARQVDGGALKVRFAPDWLAWLPSIWAPYWVVDLDPEYAWAVVGGPSRRYLWILSRTPSMERALFEAIRDRAAQRGYPVVHLIGAAPVE